jgi:hypothetical protein
MMINCGCFIRKIELEDEKNKNNNNSKFQPFPVYYKEGRSAHDQESLQVLF